MRSFDDDDDVRTGGGREDDALRERDFLCDSDLLGASCAGFLCFWKGRSRSSSQCSRAATAAREKPSAVIMKSDLNIVVFVFVFWGLIFSLD